MIEIGTKVRVKRGRWRGERLNGTVIAVHAPGPIIVVEIEKGPLNCTADDLVVIDPPRATRRALAHAPARGDAR